MKFYDYPNQPYRRISTSPSSVKVSSVQTWDETGGSDRRGYAVLKLDQVDDIYGTNQGTYIYDVDFNLTLTGADTLAPTTDAGDRKAHCVYLGFYGGPETDSDASSYSVINFYQDKIVESWERDNNDKGELASFEGDGLADGKYNIKYEYITGASASAARVNIVLTRYKADGATLESTPVMSITDRKLKHMLAESTETYSAATKASLGWIEVGVRTPYTGSSIEITKASFDLKQNMSKDLFISEARLYADEKLPQNRVFALENGRTYSKLFVDLFVEKLNTTPSNKKIDVILALYKKENDTKRLVFIDMQQCDFEKQNNYACSFEIDSFMAKEGTIIKLFVWTENGCPESDPQEFIVGTVTDLTTRDLELIKSRIVSNIYSNSIDVSSTTALLTDGRFSDLSYDASENCVNALTRASNMLKAYFSVGNNMYMNETLKAQIADVLEDWAQNDYQSSNWWWNDIGVPNILSSSFVYPLEDIISSSTLSTLMTIARRGIPSIDENKVHKNEDAAGANLIDKLVIALRIAALTGDTEGMEIVSRLLENELQVFTQASAEWMDEYVSGNASTVDISDYEGIAPDYSFKQHGILYTGGYGKSFTDGIATLLAWLQDTQYMPSSRAVNLYADFILDGYAPMFKGEGSDFSIMGRNISRETEENAVKFTSKKAIETLTKYPQISRRIELMNLYDGRIIDNDNGTTFAKHYWASDYTVFHRPDYFVGVKNFSNRNISTEFINGENRYGFYLSDGATAILKTGMEYRGIYPVWDWSRIPGTTTTYLEGSSVQIGANNNVANNMFQNGTKNFVGGVSDGIYAVSAMDYEHKHGSSNYKTSAKKAVFMFDDGFVSLGANINGTDWFNPVNTTLNQCNLNGDVTYSEDNLSTKKLTSETEETISAKWINHDGVSYILPSAQNITVSNKAKTGNWRKINNSGSEDEITKNVFTAYINHGTSPSSASYEYTVLPSATIDETKSYSDSPDMLTVTNTNDIQSVWSKKANALGAVFYSGNQTISIGTEITGFENTLSIKSSNPCIVLLKKTETGWKLSVSDPTNGSISNTVITVNGVAHDVTLPTGNNCGKTITLDI